MTEEYF